MPATYENYLAAQTVYYKLLPHEQFALRMEALTNMAKKTVQRNSHISAEDQWVRTEADLHEYIRPDINPFRNTKTVLWVLGGVPFGGYVLESWEQKCTVAIDWYFRRIKTFRMSSVSETTLINRVYDIILERM
jgi:hypothetical protein